MRIVVGRAEVGGAAAAVSVDSPFDLASLTKPLVTAPLLVHWRRRGRLRLDDPLERHLEATKGHPIGQARLGDLARHVAGLPAWLPLYRGLAEAETQPMRRDERVWRRYLEAIVRQPLGPVGQVVYSDLGYLLLGEVCRRLGGGLDDQFGAAFRGPCRLGRLGFARPDDPFPDAVATESENRFEQELAASEPEPLPRRRIFPGQVHDGNAWFLGAEAGHAGAFGSVLGVEGWARRLLRGEVPGWLAEDYRVLWEPAAQGRSVGWEAARLNRAVRGILPEGWVGHLGFSGTSLWVHPETRSGILLLTNRVYPQVGPGDFQWVRRAVHRLAIVALNG